MVPIVEVKRSEYGETLLINDIPICEHDRLYITDILLALEEFGIIKYKGE